MVRGRRDHCFRMFSLKHTSKIRQNFYAGREEGLEKKNQGIDMMICKKRTAAVSRIIFFQKKPTGDAPNVLLRTFLEAVLHCTKNSCYLQKHPEVSSDCPLCSCLQLFQLHRSWHNNKNSVSLQIFLDICDLFGWSGFNIGRDTCKWLRVAPLSP